MLNCFWNGCFRWRTFSDSKMDRVNVVCLSSWMEHTNYYNREHIYCEVRSLSLALQVLKGGTSKSRLRQSKIKGFISRRLSNMGIYISNGSQCARFLVPKALVASALHVLPFHKYTSSIIPASGPRACGFACDAIGSPLSPPEPKPAM